MTNEELKAIAREAGINFDPAGEHDDGIDTWYGSQYLPSGSLQRLVAAVVARERSKAWRTVNKLIEPGDLGGNGCDNNATRNGIILSANALMASIHDA